MTSFVFKSQGSDEDYTPNEALRKNEEAEARGGRSRGEWGRERSHVGGNLSPVMRVGDKDLQETRLNGLCLCGAEKISLVMKWGDLSLIVGTSRHRRKGALVTYSEPASALTRAAVEIKPSGRTLGGRLEGRKGWK